MSTHTSVRFRLAIKDHRNNSELPAFCHSGKFILFLKLKYSVLRPNGARPTEAGRLTVMPVRRLLVRNSRRRRKARPGIVRTASDERARPGPAHWWQNVSDYLSNTKRTAWRELPSAVAQAQNHDWTESLRHKVNMPSGPTCSLSISEPPDLQIKKSV